MWNQLQLIGNLTKDPEMRSMPDGKPVCRLSVATNHKLGGGKPDEVLYVDVSAFGKMAENCGQYLAKGRKIFVQGRLKKREWEYEGKKHSALEIIASDIKFLSAKGASTTDEAASYGPGDVEPF